MAEAGSLAFGPKLLFHLGAKAVHKHDLDPHGMDERQILHEGI